MFFKCPVRYKAKKEARKRKEVRKKEIDELPANQNKENKRPVQESEEEIWT